MVLQNMTLTLTVSALAAVSLPVMLVLVLLLCVPCLKKKRGFSNFNNSTTSLDTEQGQINNSFTLTVDDANGDFNHSPSVTIEPLPDITSKLKPFSAPLRPRITSLGKARQDTSLKLTVHHPFPRNQIVYLKELGTGWFGKVIESDAEKILIGIPRSKVVVKMLKDDASREEKHLFFEEVAPFRLLEHKNIMHILGQCTETAPLLMILEAAAYGNLKQYLCSHRHCEALLIQKNRLMQFAVDAACGLSCLHRHDYLHRDLAARNCLVMGDYTLKIGDYGIAENLFKEDYFHSGAHLLPIRWMAPETLKQENGSWTLNGFSKQSDIWSLGIVLWEIVTMGEQPYGVLTDEEVLQKVVVERDIHLQEPQRLMPHKNRLYELMQCCWMDHSKRIQVDEIHGLLQAITNMNSMEAASGDAISAFDQKWAQLLPNQHHWSADSIDSQLASASRGDVSLVSDLSQPNSVEDLTAPDLNPDNSFHTRAIIHSSAGDGFLMDEQKGQEPSVRQTGTPAINSGISPVVISPVAADCTSATFHTNSSALLTNHTSASSKGSSFVFDSDQTETFSAGLDSPVNGQLPSGSENRNSGFDVLECAADLDLADGKSVSDSVCTFQSSLTGDVSMDKDSSSCEFVVINDSKDSAALTLADSAELNGSSSAKPGEKTMPSNPSQSTVSELQRDETPAVDGTSRAEDTNPFTSFGPELSSLNSLTVQAPPVDPNQEQSFPSFGTEMSTLSSLTVPSLELQSTPDPCNGNLPGSEKSAPVCTRVDENSPSLQALNDFHFDTLGSLLEGDRQTSTAGRQELPVQNKDSTPDLLEALSAADFPPEKNSEGGQRTECDTICTTVSETQKTVQESVPAGLENGGSVSEDSDSCASDSNDVTLSKGEHYIPHLPTDTPVISDRSAPNGFSEKTPDTQNGSMTHSDSDGMLHVVSDSTEVPSTASSDFECLGATGGSSTDVESSSTDTESSTNSDSGKDYICEEAWEDHAHSPPPSSPTSSVDSEEYALQIASEIYLSRGLKMGRPFESTFLEPIPEDPIPSISEESAVHAPSESSSVDVKFDEVFEWDDFMGEPLVGKERSSPPEAGSPSESFDMSDWMLDMESDSMPSTNSSLASQHSDTFRKERVSSDSRNTVTTDSTHTRPSALDVAATSMSQGWSQNHKSYITDLLSNRTKVTTTNSASSRTSSRSNFYSLYEEDFDLESDSQSEGGNSPPVPSVLSDVQYVSRAAGNSPPPYITEPRPAFLESARLRQQHVAHQNSG
ncbi:uncharacterized protein LOC143292879 [Babylonia areolata]|uniref:uncharacterized protein LOC143292879 n=1 Tax=Babylonia areolata TaxID=304850 RepID=UPI003FD32E74